MVCYGVIVHIWSEHWRLHWSGIEEHSQELDRKQSVTFCQGGLVCLCSVCRGSWVLPQSSVNILWRKIHCEHRCNAGTWRCLFYNNFTASNHSVWREKSTLSHHGKVVRCHEISWVVSIATVPTTACWQEAAAFATVFFSSWSVASKSLPFKVLALVCSDCWDQLLTQKLLVCDLDAWSTVSKHKYSHSESTTKQVDTNTNKYRGFQIALLPKGCARHPSVQGGGLLGISQPGVLNVKRILAQKYRRSCRSKLLRTSGTWKHQQLETKVPPPPQVCHMPPLQSDSMKRPGPVHFGAYNPVTRSGNVVAPVTSASFHG